MPKSQMVLMWDHAVSFNSSKLSLAHGHVVAIIEEDDNNVVFNSEVEEFSTKAEQIHTANAASSIRSLRSSSFVVSVRNVAPRASGFAKLCEKSRLVSNRIRLNIERGHDSDKPLTRQGQFVQIVVEPLYTWYGKNQRVLSSPCLPRINIHGKEATIVNGTSHDYIGFYQAEKESESLQHLCLEKLPVTGTLPLLEDTAHNAIANFFSADFCYTTSTGYGSNYAALPAIIKTTSAVIIDDKCHNSLFAGAYLSNSACIRKFSHNNVNHLESILDELKGKHESLIVVIEGMYSMDGDTPPLNSLHRLKNLFHFTLFCDEAHSFLSIGKTGRGCLEQWNDDHIDEPLPTDMIDIRTATLSKAIGGIGGLICGNATFKAAVENKLRDLQAQGSERLPAYAMVQTLWVLGRPSTASWRLRRLADMSRFCHSELNRFGVYVYGTPGTPILPIYAGRPSTACKLSYTLRRLGLLATPVSAPAVDIWESRVRVNLSAGHKDEDVNNLLDAIIQATQRIGICQRTETERRWYTSPPIPSRLESEGKEMSETYEKIETLIHIAAENWTANTHITPDRQLHPSTVIKAGHASRKTYGLCSGSARWVNGTFTSHISVESAIARAVGMEASLTYADSFIGLASTIAALSRPLIGYRKHYMLVGTCVPGGVIDGLRIAPMKGRPTVLRYTDNKHLLELVKSFSQKSAAKQTHLTIYIHLPDLESPESILSPLFATISSQTSDATGITLLIHSPCHIFNSRQFTVWPTCKRIQTLIYGSFHQTLGLPGAFLAGEKRLIQEFRYTSRAYMYTTSPPPWILEMVGVILER